jgi:phospholipid transport system substrate-binding protein
MLSSFTTSRRMFLAGLAGFSLAPLGATAAIALTKTDAEALINRLVKDIFVVINSGKPEARMYVDFERVFSRYADVPIIARYSLGVDWRSATAAQKKAYVEAFRGYISRKYGKRFREFIGSEIKVTNAKQVKQGYLVESVVTFQGQPPFIVEWQVSDKSGKNMMFNLYIEGINMLATERTEIGAMLDKRRGNVNKLIEFLKTAS